MDWEKFFVAKMIWCFTQHIIHFISKEKYDLAGSDFPAYLNRDARFSTGQYQHCSSIYYHSCAICHTGIDKGHSNEITNKP
eukprot:7685260-Ditylum_brightwellii.AAC.1